MKKLPGWRKSAISLGQVLGVCLGLQVTAHAELTVTAGAFRVQFWDQADGDHVHGDETVAAANLGTWDDAAERAAVLRAFEYWTTQLGAPNAANVNDTNAPLIRVIIDTTDDDANARSTMTRSATPSVAGSPVLGKTNTFALLAEGTNPGTVNGLDGRIQFSRTVIDRGTDRLTQVSTLESQLERTALHEVGHLLGLSGNGAGGPRAGVAITVNTNNEVHRRHFTNEVHRGPQTLLLSSDGVPYELDGTDVDFAHNDVDFHNITRAEPFGKNFRNITHASPLDLANLADMGYGGIDLGDAFGVGHFDDATLRDAPDLTTAFTSDLDFATGYFLQGEGHDITLGADINITGFAGTGIRIADLSNGDGTANPAAVAQNIFRISTGTDINVNAENGIGIYASSGANNVIVHRGAIRANGTNGIGSLFDFGFSTATDRQVSSEDYGDYLIDRFDISGSISAQNGNGNVIQIADNAAVREINIMAGAALSGNIVSDAFNGSVTDSNGDSVDLARPVMTFGKQANSAGEATSTANNAFSFTYGGNVHGPTNVEQAVLDFEFFGGQTTFTGNVRLEDVTVRNSSTANFNGLTVLENVDILLGTVVANGNFELNNLDLTAGLFRSNATSVLDEVVMNGGEFRVATGTTTVNEHSQFNGTTNVESTLNVVDFYGIDGGQLNVNGTMTTDRFFGLRGTVDVDGQLTTGAYDMNGGALIVNNGGTLDAATFDLADGSVAVSGNMNVQNGYIMASGTTTVNAGGQLDVATLFDAQGGLLTVNGLLNSDMTAIRAGATLMGAGTVQATNGVSNLGTVAPGNSIDTLNIAGNFSSMGNLDIEIDPAGDTPGVHNDLIAVTGNALIDGGTVNVIAAPGTYAVASRYQFLTAANLAVPTRPTVVESIDQRRLINFIDATSYSLLMARDVPYVTLGITPNQIAFGGYLDAVKADPDLQTLRDTIDLIPADDDVRFAYDQMSGEIYGTHMITRLQSDSSFFDFLSGVTRNSGNFDSFDNVPQGMKLWASGNGWGGQFEGDGNARPSSGSGGGVAVGGTQFLTPNLLVGGFYGYENLNTSINALSSNASADLHRFGLQSEWRNAEGDYIRAVGMGGFADNSASRFVSLQNPFFGIAEQSAASMDGWMAGGDFEAGLAFQFGDTLIHPLFGLRYTHLGQEGFQETGGPQTNLVVDAISVSSLRSRFGARLEQQLTSMPSLSLVLNAIWQQEMLDAAAVDYNAGLASAAQNRFNAHGVSIGYGRATLSPGIVWQNEWLRLTSQYQVDVNGDTTWHSGNGVVEVTW